MSEPLTERLLRHLATEALLRLFRAAPSFEAVLQPGCDMILSNEAEADLNLLQAGRDALTDGRFEAAARSCLVRDLPFIAVLFPEGGPELAAAAKDVGLVHAADYPFMVHELGAEVDHLEPMGATDVEVDPLRGAADAQESARVLAEAFVIDERLVGRAIPAEAVEHPGVAGFLARREGRVVGSVHVTRHADTAGVWAMGTDPQEHGRGVGTRLLSTAMAEMSRVGVRRFFLGATPAGFPLYVKLGYETRVVTQAWLPAPGSA